MNHYYSNNGNKFILTKVNLEKEHFDVLFFSVHDIAEATIPDFIGIIKPYDLKFNKFNRFFSQKIIKSLNN